MKEPKQKQQIKPSIFLQELYYPQYIKFKTANLILVICWFVLILVGTVIIGAGATNYTETFEYCLDNQTFCIKHFSLTKQRQLFFYLKLYPFYQNNRLYLDSYNPEQLHGIISNADNCGVFYTYKSLEFTINEAGYRVNPTSHVHPCGQPMKTILNDSINVVDSQGGTPTLDNQNLVSTFYTDNHFIRLQNYQINQWTDVNQTLFVNWFTISMTQTKYMLLGRRTLAVGDYQLILKNQYGKNSQITKTLIMTQNGPIGGSNLILGFAVFISGLLFLFLHVFMCFKHKKR